MLAPLQPALLHYKALVDFNWGENSQEGLVVRSGLVTRSICLQVG